ncbi:hypothetical protein M9Y10_021822 [Tritrichomonas musculus]|uniref:RING-type domain-containing protein n=1 Tax=Tritrichomonas musculus TaxID=1915356 RepID=A0ABR2KSM0_9EUKA
MNKSTPELLIPIIYEKIFSPNELVNEYSLNQLIEQLDNLYQFDDLYTINLNSKKANILIDYLQQIPEVSQFVDPCDFKKSLLNISQRISDLYNSVVKSLSILKAILKYANKSAEPIEKKFSQINQNKKDFEEKAKISISDLNEMIDIDLSNQMSEFIDLYYQKKKEIKQEKSEIIDKMRDQHHMCLVCRNRPAVYFAIPCAHPCFCVKCLSDLIEKKFVYNRCLNCQSVVESVERMSFLKQ